MKNSILLVLAVFVFAACASEETAPAEAPEAPATEQTTMANEVVIQPDGNQMKYATEAFTVKSGATITLVMDNVATLEAMQHNIVILAPGTDINAVGIAAIQAGPDNEYVPDDAAVLFHTPLAVAGARVEVQFTAPEPGEYPFICTFPGHYGVMQGVMTVVA